MSRHKIVTNINKNKSYDDDDEDDYEDDFGTSPASPSATQYLYKRDTSQSSLSSFLSPKPAASPASGPGSQKVVGFQPTAPAAKATGTWGKPAATTSTVAPPPGFGSPATILPPPGFSKPFADIDDAELIFECRAQVEKVLAGITFSDADIVHAIRRANYVPDQAVAFLLDPQSTTADSGRQAPSITSLLFSPVQSKPAVSPLPPNDSGSQQRVYDIPSYDSLISQPQRLGTAPARPMHPSAKLSRPPHPNAKQKPAPTSSGSTTTTPALQLIHPSSNPQPASRSTPSQYSPSKLACDFCSDVPTLPVPTVDLTTLFSRGGGDTGGLQRYNFADPSPDDLVLEKRKEAFKQKKLTEGKPAPATPSAAPAVKITLGGPSPRSLGVVATPASGAVESDLSREVASLEISDTSAKGTPQKARKLVKQHTAQRRRELEQKMKEKKEAKEKLNMVCIGHVDAGKSTLMGHLMYLQGEVGQRTMEKYEREAKKLGKGSFAYAWVLDANTEERNRGITMDVAVNHFETEHRSITLLDAPGHKDFIPNMISGAAQADVAILVVNAGTGEFESSFESHGQTREHAVLARSLGVQQLIVAVNKLDLVGWSTERYDMIMQKVSAFLKQTGFKDSNVWFVPCSGLTGENLQKRSDPVLCSWYNGPTLLERIDQFSPPTRLLTKPLRLAVADIYKGSIAGQITVAGKIESGLIAVGDNILVMPANELCSVKALQTKQHEAVQYAVAGENIDAGLTGIETLSIGSILCDPEFPIPLVKKFAAQVVTFSPLVHPITQGYHVILHTQSVNEAGVISKLVGLTDKATGEITKKRPKLLLEKATAIVEITLARPIPLELYKDFAQLGRFLLRDAGKTIAAGMTMEFLDVVKLL